MFLKSLTQLALGYGLVYKIVINYQLNQLNDYWFHYIWKIWL